MRRTVLALFLGSFMAACASQPASESWVYSTPPCTEERIENAAAAELLDCFVPVYTVENGTEQYNRIGTPRVRLLGKRERVDVDPNRHSVFAAAYEDQIGARSVVHLAYRIHFTRIPFTWKEFYLWHDNVGLLTLVTLDVETRQPMFVTTVFTCGCYRALLPTTVVNPEALPEDLPAERMNVWGEVLSSIIATPDPIERRLHIEMRSGTHRVTEMGTTAMNPEGPLRSLTIRPMEALRRLPVEGSSGETSSFFHTKGPLTGYVRGAWNPIEGLTMGLLILDPMIGSDKDFGDPAITGTRFYTMLTPWTKDVSRLDRFEPLLRKLGYDTETLLANPGN